MEEIYPDGCPTAPQVLYLLGAMLLSMALQMDRHGLWNLLGPSLFALGIMAVAWVRWCLLCSHPGCAQHPAPASNSPLLPSP